MQKNTPQIIIYQATDGQPKIDVRIESESLWLNLQKIADLFEHDKSVISCYLKNIFYTQELMKEATVAKSATVQYEGERQITRQIEYYNLDAILSVGYRVSSTRATQFRIWATERLREHLVQGYALNQQRFDQNAAELQQAIALIRKAAHLLYFVVKNHPFSDGNKRSEPVINDTGLSKGTL